MRISAALGPRICLDGSFNHSDHGDAFVERERTYAGIELGENLEVELLPLRGRGRRITLGNAAPISRSKGPRIANAPASQSCGGWALAKLGHDGHVFAFEVGHQATFSSTSFLTANHSASISRRATSPFSTSGPDLPTVAAA